MEYARNIANKIKYFPLYSIICDFIWKISCLQFVNIVTSCTFLSWILSMQKHSFDYLYGQGLFAYRHFGIMHIRKSMLKRYVSVGICNPCDIPKSWCLACSLHRETLEFSPLYTQNTAHSTFHWYVTLTVGKAQPHNYCRNQLTLCQKHCHKEPINRYHFWD